MSFDDQIILITTQQKEESNSSQKTKDLISFSQSIQNNIKSCKFKEKNSSYILLFFIITFFLNIHNANCFSLSISSSQIYTGVLSNYYLTINNHTSPTNLILTFSDWSPNQAQPFISTFVVAQNTTGNGLSCIHRISKTIQCNISTSVFPGSIYPSQIVLKVSGIYNPSSTKPYPVSLYLNGTGGSSTVTSNLAVLQPRISTLIIDSYSYQVGKKSSSFMYLTFHYLSSNTFLNITYNNALVTIDMISDSSYYVATDNPGLKRLTNWDNPSQSFRTLKINVTNPSFSIPITIEALQYFIEGGVQFKIQKYTISLQIIPISFTQIGTISPQNLIRFGTNNNILSINSKCQIATVNGPSKNAYFQVTYDNSIINLNVGSTCVSSSTNGSISTCTLSIPSNIVNATNTYLLTLIQSLIPSNSVVTTVSLKIQSWSYLAALTQFYTTCSSTINVDILPQILSPSTSLVSCNQVVGQQNTLTIQMNVQNSIISDMISLSSFSGKIINKTGNLIFASNSVTNQYQGTLTAIQVINSTKVQFIISFTNPTYLPSQNPSLQINLLRKLSSNNGSYNIYAQTSVGFNICPVTSVLTNSTNNVLNLSSNSSYKSNLDYSIQFISNSIQFKDYVLNDYVIVNFKNKITDGTNYAQTDSPFQLYSFSNGNVPVALFNSQYNLAVQISSPSLLKIKLNSTIVVNLINDQNAPTLLLTIKSLSNPFFVSDVFCIIKTYTSNNLQKQTLLTTQSTINIGIGSQLNISTNSIITLLESNNTINLQITSLSQKSLLTASYSYINSIYYVIKTPFSCLNTNSSNQIALTLPFLNTSDINISLINCTLGYFADYTKSIQIKEYAKFSHTNLTLNISTTSSVYHLKSTCGNQCHLCDSNNLKCQNCFNSTYSIYQLFSSIDNQCYQTCPTGTYNSTLTCLSCHPICASCLNSSFNSCQTCANNYTKNAAGICESTCGSNMYLLNGICTLCNSNCDRCLNENNCYSCKSGAVLVGSSCIFSQCQFPCETCEGSTDYCLSCVSGASTDYYFNQHSCVENCPETSFKWYDSSNSLNPKVCLKIQSSNIFFVGIILSIISFGIGIGIRCCARKKAKTSLKVDEKDFLIKTTKFQSKLSETYGLVQSKQNISRTKIANSDTGNVLQSILKKYLQETKLKTKIYKLNLLRFMTVFMGYVQIICAVVILIQGNIYNPKGVNQMIAVGLAGLLITNITFGVNYFIKIHKKLSTKRQKFIQVNIKGFPNKIQIEPQMKQPVKQQIQNENDQIQKPTALNEESKQNIKDINKDINQNIFESQKSTQKGKQNNSINKQTLKINKKMLSDFDNQMLKQLFVGILSTIFTLRTYNILRSNLFLIFQNQNKDQTKIIDHLFDQPQQRVKSNSALNLPHRNNQMIDIKKTTLIQPKRSSPIKSNSKQSAINVIKIQPKDNKIQLMKKQSEKLTKRQTERKKQTERKTNQQVDKNITIVKPQDLVNSIKPFQNEKQSSNPLLQIKNQYVNKFLHPFYTYIMFASLIVVSLMFAIASAILIFKSRYQNMIIWGIDALIVIFISFLLNIFDLWKAVNLPKHQQHSQVSSVAEINQTMQNLKNIDEQDNQNNIEAEIMNQEENINQLNVTKKFSTAKKGSNLKLSPFKNKAGSIREDEIEIDPFSKIKSPKSPSQRSDKTKNFASKLKSQNKSFENTDYPEQKPPQLEIFDDLQIEENKVDKFVKAQKLPKDSSRKSNLNKVRSSNRTLYGKKTEMSNQMLSHTTRGNKSKNNKMQDIYLGFLQNQQRYQRPRQEEQNQDMTETDEIATVKLENRDLLQSIKQSSIININSEQSVGDYDWKQKQPLRIIQNNNGENKKIQEQKQGSQSKDRNE